ncbi:hypothetical protein PFISCL1PPCAC_25056, partial [Pristionchus fissidentatus]
FHRTREGLRLYNYRLTWDATNAGNGYGIENCQFSVQHNQILPSERVQHLITSDKQVHYFFITTANGNEHNIYILKHTDVIRGDYSRIEILETKMPMDVSFA